MRAGEAVSGKNAGGRRQSVCADRMSAGISSRARVAAFYLSDLDPLKVSTPEIRRPPHRPQETLGPFSVSL